MAERMIESTSEMDLWEAAWAEMARDAAADAAEMAAAMAEADRIAAAEDATIAAALAAVGSDGEPDDVAPDWVRDSWA